MQTQTATTQRTAVLGLIGMTTGRLMIPVSCMNSEQPHDTANGPTTLSPLSITVPATANVGPTSLRVSTRFGSPATPCETNYDGEVEDYLINVVWACSNSSAVHDVEVCGSYTLPSGAATLTASGTYYDTIPNLTGCDSFLTINLTVDPTPTLTMNEVACNSYTLNGQTYTSSGNYVQNYTASNGCDSTIYLNLTVDHDYTATFTESACNHFTFEGQLYTTSGTYVHTYPAANGCDSILTLDLTVSYIDTSVSEIIGGLTANESAAISYQWVDCDNGWSAIPGEVSQDFIANVNGNYAVIINTLNCADTSNCHSIINASLDDLTLANQMSLFPNPTSGRFNVDLGGTYSDVRIEVRDVLGRLIVLKENLTGRNFELELEEADAMYFVTVFAADQSATVKLLLE